MDISKIFEFISPLLAGVGGASIIILGLFSWLGKVWATRLMDKERLENQKKFEEIKRENTIELEEIKSKINSSEHIFKLGAEHKYEQRKKIKEVISKYKIRLLDSAESLNHRMWNFNENYKKMWHTHKMEGNEEEKYYLYSFVYRILVFFSWCNNTEKEMIYLDSTVAGERDLEFVKFLKVLPQVMCDTILFDGLEYNNSHSTDHFFKNDFITIVEQMMNEEKIISFEEFNEKINAGENSFIKVVNFISEISPDEEDRLRWYRLQIMHYSILIFLNNFGYDFQYTNISRITELKNFHKENPTINNFEKIMVKISLNTNKEVKLIIDELKKV